MKIKDKKLEVKAVRSMQSSCMFLGSLYASGLENLPGHGKRKMSDRSKRQRILIVIKKPKTPSKVSKGDLQNQHQCLWKITKEDNTIDCK